MDHYNKIVSILDKPYIKNLISIGVTEEHYEEIFRRIFNVGIKVKYRLINKEIRNEDGYLIYFEDSDGEWMEQDFNDDGQILYYENSNGEWMEQDFNDDGQILYYENSNGYQRIYKYDEDGLIIVE